MWAIGILVSLMALPAFAQNNTGQISGLVTDPSGAVVPDANVEVVNKDTGIVRTTVSNNAGYYVLPNLQPGNYTITVKASGFETSIREGIKLEATQSARVDYTLTVGATMQTVEVTANASPLNRENAELKTGITPENLDEIPLFVSGEPRNMAPLVTLIPGVSSGTNDAVDSHMNGAMEYESETIVDGVTVQYPGGGNGLFNLAIDLPMSPDMISEVKVLTSNYEPQYGNAAGAVVVMETKSGTDAFHGSAYEYLRNTVLDAREFDAPRQTPDIENDFGARVGGPIPIPRLRNAWSKPFFFVDWERYRQAGGDFAPTLTIPSMQEREGNFSDWKSATGALIPIYDPATTTIVSGVVHRQQFMGCDGNTPNVICPSDPRLQNSLAKQWFQYLPTPTSAGPVNNYLVPTSPLTYYTKRNNALLRFDEYLGEKDHISGSYWHQHYPPVYYSELPVQLSNDYYCNLCRDKLGRLNWDHTITPTLLNHFATGYFDARLTGGDLDTPYTSSVPEIAGVPGHAQPPVINFSEGFYGFGVNSGNANIRGISWSYDLNDLLTWIRGKHTIKFGVEYRLDGLDHREAYNQSGTFNFASGETGLLGVNSGSPIASFLLGQVDSGNITAYANGANIALYPRQVTWAPSVGDTWKATRKLSVNYGIRWDLKTPAWAKDNVLSFLCPNCPNPEAGNLPGSLAFAGTKWGPAS
jgi:hypothetical protein